MDLPLHLRNSATVLEQAARDKKLWPGDNNYEDAASHMREAAIRIEELTRLATDRQYFMWAYENMLGEKGLEVANMWKAKNVRRVHFSWGNDAASLTGEERAAVILEWEAAPKRIVENVDAEIG